MTQTSIDGTTLVPGDQGYETARLPFQRKLDPRPAIIVDAASAADVVAAVRHAREQGLSLTVMATGHGAVAPADDGLLLKTDRMTSIDIDARRHTARVGAGVTWGDVIAAAAPHGLATLSGTSAGVGVVGYTLGGGTGFLSRKYGYAADNVVRAEIVTADGEHVTASATEHPDLFWAMRGGGGNFGIVTALEFRLFPVDQVYAGMVMFDPARAGDAFRVYREWALDEPDESNTALTLMTMPPLDVVPEPVRGKRVLALRAFCIGDTGNGRELYAPLLEAAGEPIFGGLRGASFADAAAMLGPAPPPMAAELHIELLREVPDAAIDAVMDVPFGVELRHWGGAIARPAPEAGPIGHRDVPFSIVISAMAPDRAGLAPQLPAHREAVERLRPYAHGGSFLNFLGDPERTSDAYTASDWKRLTEVKAQYDPDNVFAGNHNIPPA
jgi:FAD/FMN-containing dehydrogenase